MSGSRAVPLFFLVLLLGMSLSGVASVTPDQPSDPDEADDSTESGMKEIAIGGGTITLPEDFEGGERFLQFVEPPVFTRTEEARGKTDLQPGDQGDQASGSSGGNQRISGVPHVGEEPVVLERRITDYSYVDEDPTGHVNIHNVAGTPDQVLCVCDAEFIFEVPQHIEVENAKYLWFDNITMFGGGIHLIRSQDIIVSHSDFIDSGGIVSSASESGYIHDITVVQQRGPLNVFRPSNFLEELMGEYPECWPHTAQPCPPGGVMFMSGASIGPSSDWTVEWSHFHGPSGVVFILTDIIDLTVRHNTFRDSRVSFNLGENEISWNLFRGVDTGSPIWSVESESASIHNNSILFPFKLDSPIPFIDAKPGVNLMFCSYCDLKHNDFLGYGLPHPDEDKYPALCTSHSNFVIANDNYWGTIHDPRIPEGQWICTSDGTELVLDRWETQPIHDITPIMSPWDPNDIPYWTEQLTGLPIQDFWNDLPLPDE